MKVVVQRYHTNPETCSEELRFDFWQGQDIFVLSKASTSTQGHIKSPIQWVLWSLALAGGGLA